MMLGAVINGASAIVNLSGCDRLADHTKYRQKIVSCSFILARIQSVGKSPVEVFGGPIGSEKYSKLVILEDEKLRLGGWVRAKTAAQTRRFQVFPMVRPGHPVVFWFGLRWYGDWHADRSHSAQKQSVGSDGLTSSCEIVKIAAAVAAHEPN